MYTYYGARVLTDQIPKTRAASDTLTDSRPTLLSVVIIIVIIEKIVFSTSGILYLLIIRQPITRIILVYDFAVCFGLWRLLGTFSDDRISVVTLCSKLVDIIV